MRREVHQSFAFLRGIEPASRVDSFETTMSQITDGDIVATLEETGKKRGLEESIQGLQASMKSSADTFSKLSKQFANKLQMQPENASLNSIDPSGYSQMFFSQPWTAPNPLQFYNPSQYFPSFIPNQNFPYAGRGPIPMKNITAKKVYHQKPNQTAGQPTMPLKTPSELKFCNHCNRQFHTASECFSLHPELLEEFRAKRARRAELNSNHGTIAVIEGDVLRTTAMLIIGATTLNDKPLYICQDSGASINGITLATARDSNVILQRLRTPMKALLGNGDEIVAGYKTVFQFRYGKSTFTLPCYVFSKLKFQVVIGNRFLYKRSAIVVYETLSTYLRDDDNEKVLLSNSIGKLAQKLKLNYLAVIAEETVLPPLSSQSLPIYIVEEEDDTLPTF